MKHTALTAIVFSLFFVSLKAQSKLPTEGPLFYFNSFQNYYTKNADSALYFARLLANEPESRPLLQELLHNSFAQGFINRQRIIVDPATEQEKGDHYKKARELLLKMVADENKVLRETLNPVLLWTKVQDNENNANSLAELSKQFIAEELSKDDIYQNRIAKYALLIHQVISLKEELKDLSAALLDQTMQKLEAKQVKVNIDSADRRSLEKRAWYRYLYAYSNFKQAEARLKKGEHKEAAGYLKQAYSYSPDITDRQKYYAYFYDMVFLFGKEKKTFKDDYITYLTNSNENKKQILSALTELTLAEPGNKEQLKSFYTLHFSGEEDFTSYWSKAINRQSKTAPAFTLKQVNGADFSTETHKGKWILIDFWGTWCGPCRKEHPDLQKFYETVSTKHADKMKVITVACNDTESKVNAYVAEYKYTFPVAMSDKKIERNFNVAGYPHKVLITPERKFIIIPFGVDWVDYIKQYTGL